MSNTTTRTRHAVYGNVPLAVHRKVLAVLKREQLTMSSYIAQLVEADISRRETERKAARRASRTTHTK